MKPAKLLCVLLLVGTTSACADPDPGPDEARERMQSSATDAPTADVPSDDAPNAAAAEQPASAAPPEFGLKPIAYDEFSLLVEPGLGCSFETKSGDTIFVATAPDDRQAVAEAVVRSGATPVVLEADRAGGYAALQEGGSYSDGIDLSVTITRDPGEGTSNGIETTSWPARLTVRGEEGSKREYARGVYSCGA